MAPDVTDDEPTQVQRPPGWVIRVILVRLWDRCGRNPECVAAKLRTDLDTVLFLLDKYGIRP